MTDYLKKSFTVPASGKREDPCTHGWLDPRGRCVLCGETPPLPEWATPTPEGMARAVANIIAANGRAQERPAPSVPLVCCCALGRLYCPIHLDSRAL